MKNETTMTFPPLTDEAAFQEAVVLWVGETLEAEFGFDPTEISTPEYELEQCCRGELSPEEFLAIYRDIVQGILDEVETL